MPAATIGAGFWSSNDEWITAVVTVVVALALAFVINRWLAHRWRRIAEAVMRGELTPEVDTRLRFMRRLLYAAIVLIGIAIALSQVTGLDRLATSLLASSAIAAAIIGFAARQTLANVVAGIMLAITQPLRVGDWVTFEDQYGVVEDVRLNFTLLRTPSDQRIIIPNEKLATGILRNDTLVSGQVGLDVTIWLPHTADVERAVEALEEEARAAVSVAESSPEGIRLAVAGSPCPPSERAIREADLRARCLRRLRAESLLPVEDGQG
jgi:small-conductance mechanosensitive channel